MLRPVFRGDNRMAIVNLTEARIRDLALGSGIHRDEQVKGLMVICHSSTKTYAAKGSRRTDAMCAQFA